MDPTWTYGLRGEFVFASSHQRLVNYIILCFITKPFVAFNVFFHVIESLQTHNMQTMTPSRYMMWLSWICSTTELKIHFINFATYMRIKSNQIIV